MRTIATTKLVGLEVLSAYAAPAQQIPSVTSSPGWYVVGAFFMPVTEDVRLQMTGAVSVPGLTMRARLFDLTDALPVGSGAVELVATTDTRVASGEFELRGGRSYQIQVEVVGPGGFGSLKEASLF